MKKRNMLLAMAAMAAAAVMTGCGESSMGAVGNPLFVRIYPSTPDRNITITPYME